MCDFVTKVVRLEYSALSFLLRKTADKDARRKLVKDYLNKNMAGKEIIKEYQGNTLVIRNTKTDVKHLVHNEHLDTSLSLIEAGKLIEASEYIGENPVDLFKEETSPNDYYWYFMVNVEIDSQIFSYTLVVCRNKTDKHVGLYDILNYKKKER